MKLMYKVLIVEDDEDIVDLLSIHLKDLSCDVVQETHGTQGLKRGLQENFDLIILDIMLPGTDGLEICRSLRANNVTTPILMLTAKSEEIDKILGLETGADDYLTKPFSVREFIARVKAIFRRLKFYEGQKLNTVSGLLQYDDLEIDPLKRKVTLKNDRVDLTPKEFDLLYLMASNPGTSYSRSRLLSQIWGLEYNGYEHTVNSHINRLRAKIEKDLNEPRYILTTWGVGYRFADE